MFGRKTTYPGESFGGHGVVGPWKSRLTPGFPKKTRDVVLHQVHSNVTVFLMDLENANNLYIHVCLIRSECDFCSLMFTGDLRFAT